MHRRAGGKVGAMEQSNQDGARPRADVLAAGRASEIVDLRDGWVLRRFKRGGDPAKEAEVMMRARRSGYPVPRVREVRSDGLLLERIEGRTMADDARRRPWRFRAHAATLARLHHDLRRIEMPRGEVLLHRDLHWKMSCLVRAAP
ncbi:MAG: hypothetical protein ACJ77E_18690 [Gaiellaceae bacterium]